MRKILGIVALVLLSGCDNFNKNYPTKLFGIEILENVNDYKIGDKDLTTKDGIKNDDRDTWFMSSLKISFNESSNFESYAIDIDKNLKIVEISGYAFFEEERDNFKNKCETRRDDFLKGVSKLHNFPFRNFKNKYFINNRGSSDKKTTYTDRKYIIFKKNNEELILAASCIYTHDELNVVQKFGYWIEVYDYTKERMIGYNMKETKKLKNEMIKFDFTGL